MEYKMFDLNIEKILENWETHHAIREIIANALDEQLLTNTKDIDIFKDNDLRWHIRDFGRGLKYEHLTQNENQEKLMNPNLIGKFGIGLKDALATFDRNDIDVLIKSKYGDIKITKSTKYGFDDIVTLHATIYPPSDKEFVGTDIILSGVSDNQMNLAKNMFFKFSNETILDQTEYGQILEKVNEVSNIYLNGVKVAEESNFLFSYNITSLDSKIKKSLNRERSNVGRTAYSDRVKLILLSSTNSDIAQKLSEDLTNFTNGVNHDELKWIDVQEHAVKILNTSNNVVFVTSDESIENPDSIDDIIQSGQEVVIIPANLKDKVLGQVDLSGNKIREFNQYHQDYAESFQYKFINPSQLTKQEYENTKYNDKIIELVGGKPYNVKDIKISETIRNEIGQGETSGVWLEDQGLIVIKRNQLLSLKKFAGTLIHELIHAKNGHDDVTRAFEIDLTENLGAFAEKILKSNEGNRFVNLFKK